MSFQGQCVLHRIRLLQRRPAESVIGTRVDHFLSTIEAVSRYMVAAMGLS
jgi:hypothetical protein